MADLALSWDPYMVEADLVFNQGDLVLDNSLYPSVLVSLFSDRLAEDGDVIPDGTTNRRGWWGDMPLPTDPDYPTPNRIGSRLWLLSRAKQTTQTLRDMETYAAESLQWMIEDGVAGAVTAVATYPALGQANLAITITQQGASTTYNVPWSLSGTPPPYPGGNRGGDWSASIVLGSEFLVE